jgi:hypothetical protein
LVRDTPIGHPEPTPVAGIFRVKIGSDYVHLTADGQDALAGSLLDLSTGENLTEAKRSGDRLEALSGFPADDFVLFPAEGEERARVLVFTDTTCPYCRKLHQEVPALRKAGVTIAYIPFPRGAARAVPVSRRCARSGAPRTGQRPSISPSVRPTASWRLRIARPRQRSMRAIAWDSWSVSAAPRPSCSRLARPFQVI